MRGGVRFSDFLQILPGHPMRPSRILPDPKLGTRQVSGPSIHTASPPQKGGREKGNKHTGFILTPLLPSARPLRLSRRPKKKAKRRRLISARAVSCGCRDAGSSRRNEINPRRSIRMPASRFRPRPTALRQRRRALVAPVERVKLPDPKL